MLLKLSLKLQCIFITSRASSVGWPAASVLRSCIFGTYYLTEEFCLFHFFTLSASKNSLFRCINFIDLYIEIVSVYWYYCQQWNARDTGLGLLGVFHSRSGCGYRGSVELLCGSPNHLCWIWILTKSNCSLEFWGLFSSELIKNVGTIIGSTFYELLQTEIEEALSEALRFPLLLSDILGCCPGIIRPDPYHISSNTLCEAVALKRRFWATTTKGVMKQIK